MDLEEFLRGPPVMNERDHQKKSTRDNIVLAAIEILSEGGDEAVTMRAVAAAVGISERTVFRHFQSRDELLSIVWAMAHVISTRASVQNADALARTVRTQFASYDERPAMVRASLRRTNPEKISQREKAKRQDNFKKCVLHGLDGIYLDDRSIRRRAAILDVITSPCAWELLTESWGMSGKQAAEAAVEAVDILINRRLPI